MAEIALVQWLFEERPDRIYARRSAHGSGSYVQVHLGFPAGGMALIDCASTLRAGRGYYSLSVIGASGAAYADDHHNTHLVFRGDDPRALISASNQEGAWIARQLEEFLRAIRDHRAPAVTGADGQAAIELAEAVEASISKSRPLRWTGEYYEPC